jgi:hypothetical protein
LLAGQVRSVTDIANTEGVDRSDVGRVLQLAFLAPDIVEAIVLGRQPVTLTARGLGRLVALPLDWTEQRRLLGFQA